MKYLINNNYFYLKKKLMQTLIPIFFFILSFLAHVSFQSNIVHIELTNVSYPNATTYTNFTDFFNGLSNKSLPSDFYEVFINCNTTISGKFTLENLQLEIKLFFYFLIY